jgi:tRNA(Ile)-lysidine synthase
MLTPESVISALPSITERIFIAYSGGIDSHVLLHLSASIDEIKSKITAVYVHHGLQQEADAWEKHCQLVCLDLGVTYKCLKVNAQKAIGQSPEEAARDARYHVLKSLLAKNDVLLLAQHREDQMETVLLQLFRGAGVQGLSGMPLIINFGLGVMCRPLLDVSKQDVQNYAERNSLDWIEDPSNKSDTFDRNFLRNQILPKLKQRWPALDKTISRSARHCASNHSVMQDLVQALLANLFDATDNTININQLLELDINKQYLVLRQWFASQNLRMPSENKLKRILTEVITAKVCGNPEVRGTDYCIRKYRNKLYCLTSCLVDKELQEKNWPKEQKLLKLDDGKTLTITERTNGIAKKIWLEAQVTIKYRKGSEKIRLPGRKGHHTLKKLYQEKAIPPWLRHNIPLIYLNDELVAISDYWISADFYSRGNEICYQVVCFE